MLKIFNTENKLLAFMFFEIFLLPMWSIGPVPFKFSFLIIIFSLIRKIPKSPFVLPFLLIILLLWIGKFYSYLFFDEINFTQTLRSTVNYLLIIAAFLYSKNIKKTGNFNWLVLLAVSFAIINISILVIGPSMPSLISFYALDLRLEEGLFFARNPGIATNPNGSALMGNLILLFWVVSNKFNLVTLKSKFWDIIVFISIGIAILSFVSKSGFFAYFLICLFILINVSNKLDKDDTLILKYGIEQVLNFDEALVNEANKDPGQDGNRIVKIQNAMNTFFYSPLFGVGSDRSNGEILNRTAYHNDWAEILVSTGFFGFLLYFIIAYRIYKLSVILLVPFIFPGMTNAFIFTMQLPAFYFLFVGIIYKTQTKLT
jgi:O-antigen ligase